MLNLEPIRIAVATTFAATLLTVNPLQAADDWFEQQRSISDGYCLLPLDSKAGTSARRSKRAHKMSSCKVDCVSLMAQLSINREGRQTALIAQPNDRLQGRADAGLRPATPKRNQEIALAMSYLL